MPALFPNGYNPFEVDNVLGSRTWLRYAEDNMGTYFRRRGMVFVDGKPLEPVETPMELAGPSPRSMNYFTDIHWTPLFKEFSPEAGKVWIEMNGMTLHIRLANDDDPAKHVIEITTQEQSFLADGALSVVHSREGHHVSICGERFSGTAAGDGVNQSRQSLYF